MDPWIIAAASAFALLSPVFWVPLLLRAGTVDVPNERSSHRTPTIRGVGVAPAGGLVVAVVLILLSGGSDRPLLLVLLAGSLAMSAVGLLEDVRGLAVPVRLATQGSFGIIAGALLCNLLGRPWWLALLVALAYVAYVNAANFMDGIDGISALSGGLAGLHFMLVGLALHLVWLQTAGALLAGVFLAFLPWNLAGSRVFLGDVGSYLLGGLVLGCSTALWLSTGQWLLAGAPLLVYLTDTGSTLVTRAMRGEPVTQAHRSHVYQRLTDRGLSHLQAAAVVTVIGGTCCALAWWGWLSPGLGSVAGPLSAAVLVMYLLLPGAVATSARSGA